MTQTVRGTLVCLIATLLVCAGCGGGEANLEMPPSPMFGPDGEPLGGPPAPKRNLGYDWSAPLEFSAPHTLRKNPFIAADGVVRTGGGLGGESSRTAETVAPRLNGFINVRGLRVVMTLQGKVHSLREGDTVDELTVVKISPPEVTLKMGENEVTQSMNDIRGDADRERAAEGPGSNEPREDWSPSPDQTTPFTG